jgi:endoglucanase
MNTLPVSRRSLLRTSAVIAVLAMAGAPFASFAQQTLDGRDLAVDKRPVIHADGPKLGAYDPYGDFSDEKEVATEHLFLPWDDVELAGLGAADEYAAARGRKVLVTIEPWSWSLDWNVSASQLRNQILSGAKDANLSAILQALSGFQSPVIIRWAQEMDSTTGRFTWSNWTPRDYISAYQRMVDIIRKELPNAQVMWSPKGEKNLKDYYPGDEYVDIVGLSVFGYDRYDEIEYGQTRTFAESLKQGYDLAVGFGKPIWVAEAGYEGNLEYVGAWAGDLTANNPEFPELKEVVYFNDKEVWGWPHGLGLPDWRVVRQQTNYPARR